MLLLTRHRLRNALMGGPLMFLVLCLAWAFLPSAAYAASGAGTSAFKARTARLSVLAGGNTAFDQNYTIVGIGVGYYVADGIEAGLDAALWSGAHPRIYEAGPQLRFVLNASEVLKPYAGIFYRRTVIEGYRDADTAGGRAGLSS